MGNIQNIQTIIRPYKMNIKMGKVTLHANHNSSVHNVYTKINTLQLPGQRDWQGLNLFDPKAFLSVVDRRIDANFKPCLDLTVTYKCLVRTYLGNRKDMDCCN